VRKNQGAGSHPLAQMAEGVARLDGLPANVVAILTDFVDAARSALADDLVSVVLFGSAAEGRLKATSDVNLILVLRGFDAEKLRPLGESLLAAQAAIQLQVMFLLESEIPAAVECFAQKFADILRRHRVIFGKQVFANTKVPRHAEIFRLRQILLNLTLRLREAYVSRGTRPEQAARVLADAFGPLRAAAATLLELEGALNSDSDAALRGVADAVGAASALVGLVAAHERRPIAEPQRALLQVIDLVTRIAARAAKLA
jgi:predicted nucleotidyltransferase